LLEAWNFDDFDQTQLIAGPVAMGVELCEILKVMRACPKVTCQSSS
jgi:hypothetical protein